LLELLEHNQQRIIAALTNAGADGLTVKELRATLGTGEQATRRTLGVLLATGVVRETYRYKLGVRGAVPRVYMLAQSNALTPAATPPSAGERG
jgi:DNA-binding IclR family transcriptional regulator